jgi:hypothetical protein
MNNCNIRPPYVEGDLSDCSKYICISLMMAGYKIYIRVITERLSAITDMIISDSQKWLQKRMIVFTLKILVDKRCKHHLEINIVFVHHEKASDQAHR